MRPQADPSAVNKLTLNAAIVGVRTFRRAWNVALKVVTGCLACLVIPAVIHSQTFARLDTAETTILIAAGQSAPRLKSLSRLGAMPWLNQQAESLPSHVEIEGKAVPVAWALESAASRIGPKQVIFVYESASPRLRLEWEWRARAAYGPLEHVVRIRNLSGREIGLPLQDSFQFDFAVNSADGLKHFFVEKGADTPSDEGTHEVAMRKGYTWQGTSSTYAHPAKGEVREIIPWFLVERGNKRNDGWYVGIEFSGRTRLVITRDGNSLHGAAGLNPSPGPFRMRLLPGESFETPAIFLGCFQDGPDGGGNVLRKWVREVLTNNSTWANPSFPYLVNNSWGSGMAVDEALALRMIADSAELQFDMFHVDAGWFRGVGDWYPDPKKFPHGLAPIAEEAHRRGLKFGLWVDWSQAGRNSEPGALNVRDPHVRDWLVADVPEDWKPEAFKGQTIDIGVPDAALWARKELERLVNDNHLDMLEHDGYLVAQGCDRPDHPHAPPDPLATRIVKASGAYFVEGPNATEVSYRAVRSYYDIYASLRKAHPNLLFEVCNDGGRMVDFGSASHGDYFSITDTYDPLSNRRAFYDASFVLPAAMLETYVEKWPTSTIENFRYMLRSGMMGWLTIMQDTNAWTAEQHDVARREFEIYKTRLRPLIRDASLFHVSRRPNGINWDGMEYFDLEKHKGALYVFRGSTKSEGSHVFHLKSLSLTKIYRLHFVDHTAADRSVSGEELTTKGIRIHLAQPNSSELIFLEAVSD